MTRIYSRFDVPPSIGIDFTDVKSLTQQQFKEDADINVIVERFARTGVLVDPATIGSRVADFPAYHGLSDYHELQTNIAEANEMFFDLPSHIRERLGNDPSVMLDVLLDPAQRPLAIELGFYSASPTPVAPAPSTLSEAAPEGEKA